MPRPQAAPHPFLPLSERGRPARFNAQYGGLSVTESSRFHDRFLAIDHRSLYVIGASLKDLGRKCFAFARLDAALIPALRARIQAP
jgi:hypothetical protein